MKKSLIRSGPGGSGMLFSSLNANNRANDILNV